MIVSHFRARTLYVELWQKFNISIPSSDFLETVFADPEAVVDDLDLPSLQVDADGDAPRLRVDRVVHLKEIGKCFD